MKIYHIGGKIIQVNYDGEDYSWENTSNGATLYLIDELDPTNRSICANIQRSHGKTDRNGLAKYYIDTATGTIMERAGWVEYVEDLNG